MAKGIKNQKEGGESPSPTTEERIASLQQKAKALFDRYTVPCPHCGKPILASTITAAAGRRAVALRKTNAAGTGRPKKLTPCPKCGVGFGVAELRAHKPKCSGDLTGKSIETTKTIKALLRRVEAQAVLVKRKGGDQGADAEKENQS